MSLRVKISHDLSNTITDVNSIFVTSHIISYTKPAADKFFSLSDNFSAFLSVASFMKSSMDF